MLDIVMSKYWSLLISLLSLILAGIFINLFVGSKGIEAIIYLLFGIYNCYHCSKYFREFKKRAKGEI